MKVHANATSPGRGSISVAAIQPGSRCGDELTCA